MLRIRIFYSFFVSILLMNVGCSKSQLNDDVFTEIPTSRVTIMTRSTGDADIKYPITLYAFSSEGGTLVTNAVANNADDKLSMDMVAGSYRLIAVAGTNGLDVPDMPTTTSDIGIPESGIMDEALQRGAIDITVSDKDVTADISLTYQVAQINLELHDIPSDITEVNVTFSTLYSKESFNGDYSGSKAVTASLTKTETEGVWKAETFHVLPGSGSQLTLSIAMTGSEGTMNYGYTHTSTLNAATPYQLTGSYLEGFEVSGNVSAEGWAETETINFTFGLDGGTPSEGNNDENEDSEDNNEEKNDDGEYLVSEIPSHRTIWNGHYVAVKSNADNISAELLLMSLKEWSVLPVNAVSTVEEYTEGNLGNWHIPTEDELSSLSILGNVNIVESVNSTLAEVNGDGLTTNGLYLCNEAKQYLSIGSVAPTSFNVDSNMQYRLRLVKAIKVKLQTSE